MSVPGPGFSITMRISVSPSATTTGELTGVIDRAGGAITGLDTVESTQDGMVVDVSANVLSPAHVEQITDAVNALPSATVEKVSDRIFLMHLGGKIEVRSKVALRNRDELSCIYTPGVARVSEAIARKPDDVRRLTIKRNTVAVVTDGSAVLGLGDIGPAAALPVMEGKAALFKRFAGVDAWPVCLDTHDTEEIIRTIEIIAPVYGGINLEDISAPRCFEIEARLRECLSIPVFHDDQHGTAIVVMAALHNALRAVNKNMGDCRIVVCGVGAAGSAIIRLLGYEAPADIIPVDIDGIVYEGRPGMYPSLAEIAAHTNRHSMTGSVHDAIIDADVFIGVSASNLIGAADVSKMRSDAVVFALANPTPEIDPVEAQAIATVVATGRSDFPNQINNVLAFPGVFRGLLDAGATTITDPMLLAAAHAIAGTVSNDELNPSFIVPSVFDDRVAPAVAGAIVSAAS